MKSEEEQPEQSALNISEIRAKTTLKLEKIIKRAGLEAEAKDIAIKF